MKHTDRRQIQTIFHYRQKSPVNEQAPSGSRCENCHSVSEYWSFCARIAFCCPGVFSYLWGRNIGPAWPEPWPQCRSPPPHSDLPKKSEWRKGRWKLPSIITDKLWPWRLRCGKVACGKGTLHKAAFQLFRARRNTVERVVQCDIQLRRRCIDDGRPYSRSYFNFLLKSSSLRISHEYPTIAVVFGSINSGGDCSMQEPSHQKTLIVFVRFTPPLAFPLPTTHSCNGREFQQLFSLLAVNFL